ncbi:MAG: hypothetical protein AMXMBFR16_06750 [Candidatus Uhrbacteria bacterium]
MSKDHGLRAKGIGKGNGSRGSGRIMLPLRNHAATSYATLLPTSYSPPINLPICHE